MQIALRLCGTTVFEWNGLDTCLASPQILQGRMTTPQTYQGREARIESVVVVIVLGLCNTKFNATVSLNLIIIARAKISQQNASTSTRQYFFTLFKGLH